LSLPPVLLRALQGLGALWTSPNTLIGLAAGTAGMLAGARPSWNGRDCAIVFREFPCRAAPTRTRPVTPPSR